MKKQVVWLLAFCASALAHSEPVKGLIPPYQITKNEVDASLKKTEGLFVFTFRDVATGMPVKGAIKGSGNGVEKTIQPDDHGQFLYRPTPGIYRFQFFFNQDYYEVYTDSIELKPGFRIEVTVNFMSSLYPVIMDKPVIYVYPSQTTSVNIQLDIAGSFKFTYPPYNNGWDFIADPNGTIHQNTHQYKYLFWEGETNINTSTINWSEGFIVESENLLSFFENKLTLMGLTAAEQQDYITYWYPLMMNNKKNYIHFMFDDAYNEYAHLTINPKPDNMLRVFMLWANAEDIGEIMPKEQSLPSCKREGFTLIEWGGAEVNGFSKISNLFLTQTFIGNRSECN